MVSKKRPTPYVLAQVLGGRLVRVCPECEQHIAERTDDDGLVSNHFAEHYEAEHHEQEPERKIIYVLAPQAENERGRAGMDSVARVAVEHAAKQFPEVDWRLVDRLEDLPEAAPIMQAAQILRGSWHSDGDDPQVRRPRFYRREGDHLVFTPTMDQIDEWDKALDRFQAYRSALVERHRDRLPRFSGKTVEDWEHDFYPEFRRQAAELAKDFDAQKETASDQFFRGDYRWAATIEAAIASFGIPEERLTNCGRAPRRGRPRRSSKRARPRNTAP